MRFKILFILLSLFFINSVSSETVVYDNITGSQYKTLKIQDDLNIKYINDYPYEVYVNNSYIGNFKKDEIIYIPDDSNITIFIPKTISTNPSEVWDASKTQFYIALMYIISVFIVIIIIVWVLKRIWK